jgi:hypothetical protein
MGCGLAVLKTPGKNAQGEQFCFRHGLAGSGSLSENSGGLRHFGEPAPVFFAFVLNREFHVSPRRLDTFCDRSILATQPDATPLPARACCGCDRAPAEDPVDWRA